MFTAMTPSPTPISRQHNKKLVKVIQALLVLQQSNLFRKPIPHKALCWDDYKEIVKKPIDLNLVRRQYNEGKYKFVEEVLDDLELVFDNVFMYNKREHETFDLAIRMLRHFDDLVNQWLPQYGQKINRTLYWRQFENNTKQEKPQKPQKTQKKQSAQKIQTSRLSKTNNNQMQVQHPKVQTKNQVVFQPTLQNRRRQSSNSRRVVANQVQQQKPQMNNVTQQSVESKKKPSQSQAKTSQQRKQANISQQPQAQPQPQKPAKPQPRPQPPQQPLQPQPPTNQKPQPQPQNPFQPQSSHQNLLPPIIVQLNKTPTFQQVNEITVMMKVFYELGEFEILSKIVKILTKFQKENMVIDGEDVSFKMMQIHVSTYELVRKQIMNKISLIRMSDSVNKLQALLANYNLSQAEPIEEQHKIANGF